MAVSTATLFAPAEATQPGELRPATTVVWSGGTGPYDLVFEWDTDPGFGTGNLIQVPVNGLTGTVRSEPPSSDLSFGTTWWTRVKVTDTADMGSVTTSAVSFTPTDPDIHPRFLHNLVNVGRDGDPLASPRFLYVYHNVDTTVPVPWIESISPTVANPGDTLVITGQGFDNVARDWGAAARLYDNPDPLDPGASFLPMTELGFTAGADRDELVVQIPGGATSGWVVVVNDDGGGGS